MACYFSPRIKETLRAFIFLACSIELIGPTQARYCEWLCCVGLVGDLNISMTPIRIYPIYIFMLVILLCEVAIKEHEDQTNNYQQISSGLRYYRVLHGRANIFKFEILYGSVDTTLADAIKAEMKISVRQLTEIKFRHGINTGSTARQGDIDREIVSRIHG